MGWKTIKGRRYYYRSAWGRGRARAHYVPPAIAPAVAELQAARARSRAFASIHRAWRRRECERRDAEDALLAAFDAAAEAIARAALGRAGYHRPNRGPWRRRRAMAEAGPSPDVPPAIRSVGAEEAWTAEGLAGLIGWAAGDASALPGIHAFLDDLARVARLDEAIDLLRGDAARSVERQMIGDWKGGDLAGAEAARRKLAGPEATPIERLLAERAALCWLAVYRAESGFAAARGLTIPQSDAWQRRIGRAHRMFLSALRALATVRRLAVPAVQVNVAGRQVNVAGR